jgi:hypothetical protein
VDDPLDAVLADHLHQPRQVEQLADGRHPHGALVRRSVVVRDDLLAGVDEGVDDVASERARSSGDEDG